MRIRGAARFALLAVWLGLASAPAAAQTVTIRSGEHASFSRLVLYLPTEAGWRLGRSDNGYRLLTADDGMRFDTSAVFDFMPRSRILSVSDGPARLDLEVTCSCHADAFEYRPGIVVIDIKDGDPPLDARFETRIDGAGTRKTDAAGRAAAPRPLPAPRFPLAGRSRQAVSMDPASQPFLPSEPGVAFLFERGLPDETAAGLASQLAESLADAMAAGDLVPLHGSAEQRDGLPPGTGISVRTARIAPEARSAAADRCLSDAMFDVAAWRGDLPPAFALAQTRASFLDDIDAPASAAVIDAARRYVALGFGAEAAQVLSAFPVDAPEGPIVAGIAAIVDIPQAPRLRSNEASVLASQLGCGTRAELWALLAVPAADIDASQLDADAVVRHASGLPIHLRRHLAPEVSRRLRALGEDAAASMVRSSVTRSDRVPPQELVLESAISRGEEDSADLRAAASGNGATALLAQTLRLREMAHDARPLPLDLRREVEAQIHQAKGTPDGEALAAAYFRALSASRAHLHALSEIRRLHRSRMLSADTLDAHRSETVLSLANAGSDGDVIVASETLLESGEARDLSAEAREALRARLEAMGFSRLAQAVAPGPQMRQVVAPASGTDQAFEAVDARGGAAWQPDPTRPDDVSRDAWPAAPTADAAGASGDIGTRSWLAADWITAAEQIPEGPRRDVARTLASVAGAGSVPVDGSAFVPEQRTQTPAATVPGGQAPPVPVPPGRTIDQDTAPAGSRAARDALMDSARTLVGDSQALRDAAARLLAGSDGPAR